MTIKTPLKFDQANFGQSLAKTLAVSLFLSLFIPQAQAQKQKDQRGVGARPLTQVKVDTLPEKIKRYALIIGVDQYADSSITPLNGASNDAKALADALIRYAGFPADQVILLASDQPPQRQPTRGEILLRLSNLRGAAPKDGLLLVSFAGHGIERNGQAYLLPSDARIHGDIRLLQDTSISVTRMRDDIQEVGVGQVLLFLDACRNDPASGRSDSVNALTGAFTRGFDFSARNSEVTAFVTLYATEVGSIAYEYKEKRQGYFTWALVEGLRGAAANERGEVTLSRLISHVQEAVPKRVRLDLGQNVSQKPFADVKGYRADELVIAISERRAAGKSPEAESVYWNSIKDSSDPADFRAYLADFPQGQFRSLAENRLRRLEGAGNRPNPLTPVIALPRGVDPSQLTVHSFTTAYVDAKANVRKFPGSPTQQYSEDLGNGVRLEMAPVRGGTFTMGSVNGYYYEDPAHQVTVGDFWMGKFELTNAQWRAVMGTDISYYKGDKLPAHGISWDKAKEFCRSLNAKLGLSDAEGYRLPTEAEWEYAARAGTRTEFGLGETITLEIANYHIDYLYGEEPKGIHKEPVPVGSLGVANAWGLFDLAGNVSEWCEDDWHSS